MPRDVPASLSQEPQLGSCPEAPKQDQDDCSYSLCPPAHGLYLPFSALVSDPLTTHRQAWCFWLGMRMCPHSQQTPMCCPSVVWLVICTTGMPAGALLPSAEMSHGYIISLSFLRCSLSSRAVYVCSGHLVVLCKYFRTDQPESRCGIPRERSVRSSASVWKVQSKLPLV